MSPSMRREWIEMEIADRKVGGKKSPSMRREWIEIEIPKSKSAILVSPSMRREWIEILLTMYAKKRIISLPPCGGSGLKYQ